MTSFLSGTKRKELTLPEASKAHLNLAGMALAHAVWSIEDGETLCTMAMLQEGEERSVSRYEAETIADSVAEALADLKPRLLDGSFAALVYDGFYTGDDGVRRDAVILELLAANEAGESANTAAQVGRIVQQYTPGKRALFRKTRVALVGRPIVFGDLPEGAAGLVVEGALEHEKVRDLFEKV
jgi:hypothetical protein